MSRLSFSSITDDSLDRDLNIKKDEGKFTFSNGDTYAGGYMITKDKRVISRQGRGTYVTQDFNNYETYWTEDRITSEVHIRHNNGTQYQGSLGVDGKMFGFGIYTFIDNSVLRATWDQNKPAIDIVLRESLGSIWKGLCNDKEIMFTSGNHFWDEISTPEERSHPDTEVKLDNNEFQLNQ